MLRDCEAPITFYGDRCRAVGVYSSGTAEDMLTKRFDEVLAGCVQISEDNMATSLSVCVDGGLVWVERKRERKKEGEARAGQVRETRWRGPKFLRWPGLSPRNFFSGVGGGQSVRCEWPMSLGTG
jgi:hypothetical protein